MTQEGFVLSRFESPRSVKEMGSLAMCLQYHPSCLAFFLHSVRWPPVNWASGIPLQDEGIRAGVTVESLGKLKACDMQIGRKKNAWNPTARARVLAWWRRAAKSYCAIPSICPPVMRCINISSTRLLRRMFGEDSAQKKKSRDLTTIHFSGVFLWQDFFLSHLRVSLKCNEHQVPWVLDPVAAGFTPLRYGNGRKHGSRRGKGMSRT